MYMPVFSTACKADLSFDMYLLVFKSFVESCSSVYAVKAVMRLYVSAAVIPFMTPVLMPLSLIAYPNVDNVSMVAFVSASL